MLFYFLVLIVFCSFVFFVGGFVLGFLVVGFWGRGCGFFYRGLVVVVFYCRVEYDFYVDIKCCHVYYYNRIRQNIVRG